MLESKVARKKRLNRLVLEQTRRNGDDLRLIKSRLDRYDGRLGGSAGRFDSFERRFDGLSAKFDALTKALPKIVGDVMREVLRERGGKI